MRSDIAGRKLMLVTLEALRVKKAIYSRRLTVNPLLSPGVGGGGGGLIFSRPLGGGGGV